MKARLFDRILLALLLLFIIALAVLLIVLSIGLIPLANIQNIISNIFQNINWLILTGGCGFVLLLIAVRLMFASSTKVNKEVQPTSTLIKTSEFGSSFITLSALDSMVQKHCRANNKIKATQSTVIPGKEGGVTISVKISIMPDTEIPELTNDLQRSLKEYIEKFSGITVHEIGILIEDAGSAPKARVD